MTTQIETTAGLTNVEKKGYRYRLWTVEGYAGSVIKTIDGNWRWAYKDGDIEMELTGFKKRCDAIKNGIQLLVHSDIV